jgi:hypothetical protein
MTQMKPQLIAAATACLTVVGSPSHAADLPVMIMREGYFPTLTYLNDTDRIVFTNNSGYGAKVRECNGSAYLTPMIPNGQSYTLSITDLLADNDGKKGFRPAIFTSNGGSSYFRYYNTSDEYWGGFSYDLAPDGPDDVDEFPDPC